MSKKVTYQSIFSPDGEGDPVLMQRRAGFFVLLGINPSVIPSYPVEVYKIGKGRVRVRFTRVFPMGPAPASWDRLPVPDGYTCGHGSLGDSHEADSHEASRWDSVECEWAEVKA